MGHRFETEKRVPKKEIKMQVKAQVVNEREESFVGKRGKVEQHILSCLDLDTNHPFLNTFDYLMSDEETKQHFGKLRGKTVNLGIINFEPAFGGRTRGRGKLVSVG
jgi:hypothetical protein